MKRLVTLMMVSLATFSMSQPNHEPQKGVTISFGLHSAVPTENIFLNDWRSNNESDVIAQPLLKEWYSPKLGGYVDLLGRKNTNWVSFWGFQYSWQTLYSSSIPITSTVDGFEEMGNHYRLTKRARLNNFKLYSEHRIVNWKRLNLYARGELGLANYYMNNYFHTSGSKKKLSNYKITNDKQLNYSLSLGTALSLRYQFNELFAVNLLTGYRFNTPNNFIRRSYLTGLQGEMSGSGKVSNEYNYEIIEGNDFFRPLRLQNEYLYVQFGLIRRLNFTNDGRNFKHHRAERGEPRVDPAVAEKPILYLYPEDTTHVQVSIALTNHDFIFTYPAYPERGWDVIASPSGNLFDLNTQRNYYSLFWETEGVPIATDLTEGFLVKGADTRRFLEEKLAYLGLNEHEANEFLIYWLPKMERNTYNAIHFAFEDYEAISQLEITPKPNCLIRIMMLFTPLDAPIFLTPQMLEKAPERNGFVAVEWGGMVGEFFKKVPLP